MRVVLTWAIVLFFGLVLADSASAGCFGDTLKREQVAKMHDFETCGDRDLDQAVKHVKVWLSQDVAAIEKLKDDSAAEAWQMSQYAALKGSLALIQIELRARKN